MGDGIHFWQPEKSIGDGPSLPAAGDSVVLQGVSLKHAALFSMKDGKQPVKSNRG